MKTNEYNESMKLFKRALKVIPTGVPSHLGPVNGCFIPIDAFPLFSGKAEGSYFWDVDGNKFIDYMCAYGPNILGYNDPDVENTAKEQMLLGNCVTLPSIKSIEMAELLVNTVEMADWAFFAKNGGDVTNFSLMIAKAKTGRTKTLLIKGGYHGIAPWTQKLGMPGVIYDDIKNNIYVDWNDYEQVERAIEKNKDEIACFLATPYHHPTFEDNQMPKDKYWQKIRKLCTDNGIILAIDDIRCGFRLDLKGSDHYFGFKADLLCLSKTLGNGWNLSAILGTDEMKLAASNVFYTGTYWLSSIPFAAGIATINKLKQINATELMKKLGEKLTNGLNKVAKDNGFNLKVTGHPSMWFMRIADDDTLNLHQEWIAECVKRGVFFTSHHNQFINCSLTEADIEVTLKVADEAFKVVRKNHS
ncbi:MAG: aminotransferase class III-fold pyridoxal phosphate-dependent enzyme [Candidatus Lokiarchaeota archaeon]|nr:aminotransferase class III-fold pyridoxal phosphate-dependent enzyme [Candidatus Lokiarchaeota archaeon]